ncbi:hypothetical protein METUNv1_00018 [Methyloversatilis universalis FAM5]|uniref:Uncharacterized protein n=1 Tax=Methyloversatilis universalis (strain ATCC BAA-1314 / DSM 25237 / JCM 13912 / CCUG 52030 / FAM5) TaxID=1000565 RepID=F5R742_METUF|nr:hypothetical protein METUNv1_00018 [Methyloversatilis universalis FAM5]
MKRVPWERRLAAIRAVVRRCRSIYGRIAAGAPLPPETGALFAVRAAGGAAPLRRSLVLMLRRRIEACAVGAAPRRDPGGGQAISVV